MKHSDFRPKTATGQLFRSANAGVALPFHPGPLTAGEAGGQRASVMAKPRKVQEPAGTYAATPKPPARPAAPAAKAGVRDATPEQARKAADTIFAERHDLLHRLERFQKYCSRGRRPR